MLYTLIDHIYIYKYLDADATVSHPDLKYDVTQEYNPTNNTRQNLQSNTRVQYLKLIYQTVAYTSRIKIIKSKYNRVANNKHIHI